MQHPSPDEKPNMPERLKLNIVHHFVLFLAKLKTFGVKPTVCLGAPWQNDVRGFKHSKGSLKLESTDAVSGNVVNKSDVSLTGWRYSSSSAETLREQNQAGSG